MIRFAGSCWQWERLDLREPRRRINPDMGTEKVKCLPERKREEEIQEVFLEH